MSVLKSPVRSTGRAPVRGPLEDRYTISPFSLSAPSGFSFAAASQPFNATGISISDSTPAWPAFSDVDFLFDLENGRYYWDGAERQLSDATDNGDGTYDVDLATGLDMGNQSGFVEVTNPSTPVINHNAFSLTNVSNARFEVTALSDGAFNIFDSGTGSFANGTFDDGGGSNSIFKRTRSLWNYEAGSPRIVLTGYSDSATNSNAVANTGLDQVGIGYRRSFGGAQVFTGTFHKAVIFKANKAESELRALARQQRNQIGIHWLGDSFLNAGQIRNEFDDLAVARGQYFFTSTDQVGSSSLAQQATRFAANIYQDQTLIIVDGGLTTDDTSVTALTSIVSNLPHNRWLYVQSNPQEATGVGDRPNWDDEDAAILAFCGANHYLETKSVMQANGDGGADDLADIANDIWPRSKRTDQTHLNSAGDAIFAQAIYDRLVSEGWLAYTVQLTITGGDLTVGATTSATLSGNGTASLTISGSLADVNTELASLDIANASAGSETLTTMFINPLSGAQITKTAVITIS